MTTPFDYVNSITNGKNNMMRGTENDDLAEKSYNPWIVNRSLSMSVDTILHANITNQNYHMPNRAQYEFLLASIPKRKRYNSWIKEAKPSEDVQLICDAYQCNATRAMEYLELLSEDQLEDVRKSRYKGGDKK